MSCCQYIRLPIFFFVGSAAKILLVLPLVRRPPAVTALDALTWCGAQVGDTREFVEELHCDVGAVCRWWFAITEGGILGTAWGRAAETGGGSRRWVEDTCKVGEEKKHEKKLWRVGRGFFFCGFFVRLCVFCWCRRECVGRLKRVPPWVP